MAEPDNSNAGVLDIVIDIGSSNCKLGFAGDDDPQANLHSVLCQSQHSSYIGRMAKTQQETVTQTYPIVDGIVSNWDAMETFWTHAFYDQLRVLPEGKSVLVTDSPLNSTLNREKMAQIMFESFSVSAFYVAMQAVLSLYASGRTTGVVVDSGESFTHSVPVYEGIPLRHAIQRTGIAGRRLTDYTWTNLLERGYFVGPSDRQCVEAVKEELCYIALDYEQELQCEADPNYLTAKTYQLPDGKSITMGKDSFRIPEPLFQPSLLGLDIFGVHDATYSSIQKCDIDVQNEFYNNIVLSGGNTMLSGFRDRMVKELTALIPASMGLYIVAPPERRFSAWIGGSIIGSMGSYRDRWCSKQEYEESGSGIIPRKFA